MQDDLKLCDGILRKLTEFELIVNNEKLYLCGKICKLLLKFETEMEQVKSCMVKWMENFEE